MYSSELIRFALKNNWYSLSLSLSPFQFLCVFEFVSLLSPGIWINMYMYTIFEHRVLRCSFATIFDGFTYIHSPVFYQHVIYIWFNHMLFFYRFSNEMINVNRRPSRALFKFWQCLLLHKTFDSCYMKTNALQIYVYMSSDLTQFFYQSIETCLYENILTKPTQTHTI